MGSMIGGAILRTQSDERLVTLSRGGHQRAFEAIVERYRAELTRAVRRFLPSASVEDVLQQTHLEAWRALSGGTEVRELRAWLHRIARNAAIAGSAPGYDYDELSDALRGGPGPEEEIERREAVRRALRGIAELPERQREALLAVAVAGRSHADLACDLGITDTAARQLVRRARVSMTAFATIMTPPGLVLWAAHAGRAIVAGKVAAGAGLGGSLSGSAAKVGVIALTVGGVAAGVAPIRHALVPTAAGPAAVHQHRHHRHAAQSPPVYVAAAPAPAGAVGLVSFAQSTGPQAGSPFVKRRAAHHRRRLSATPALGGPASAAPASAALPTPAGAVPAGVPGPSTSPTAAAPAQSNGLAALIAWAIAHASPQRPSGGSASTYSWSLGQSTAGSPGRPAASAQSAPGAAGASSGQCTSSSSGVASATRCDSTGAVSSSASGG